MTFEKAFEEVKKLAIDFKNGENYYLSSKYQEAEARKDFIDKFFIALGWDVNHDHQKNPYEQEVKVERTEKMGKAQKRSDYAFTLAPNFRDTKFFAEAKKPSQDLNNDDYYFQTIRYGWNAGTPIAILTDFETLHILDCRFRPDIGSISSRCIIKFHYSDYFKEEKFREIYYLFSREAVANNSLEKRAEELPKPKGKAKQKGLFKGGYQTIDEAFLEEIDEIRETLAKAFKKNAPNLNSEELTEATQRTIDRLVFIRFLEDKLIEQEHYVSEFGDVNSAWVDFISACKKLDAKYNGVVFKKHFIDEQRFKGAEESEFKKICDDLSHVNSPYDFNFIPIHILGSIYERFLGNVVHATDKRVTIQEKPEVQKAGGVYYTPKYIVDYIVSNTIGKLITGKTPEQISKMRFADIACGSGSFLIGVFDLLLEYHNRYYQQNPDKAEKDKCIFKDGIWVLSIKQKQQILLNNIYGVDIDAQATEVTQLSLCLKLLEDESTATANEMQVLFHEKILPNLSKNIVCGNSLIGADILTFNGLFSGEDERKLNPMDFESAFPEVFRDKIERKVLDLPDEVDMDDDLPQVKEALVLYQRKEKGGFDAIVGNPPYNLIESDFQKKYLREKYTTLHFKINLYACFCERALQLIKDKGYFSYIVPNLIFANDSLSKLRLKFLKENKILQLINLGDGIFYKVAMPTMIFLLQKGSQKGNEIMIASHATFPAPLKDVFKIKQEEVLSNKNYVFETANRNVSKILKRLTADTDLLETKLEVNQGIITGNDKKYISDSNRSSLWKETIRGKDISRYVTSYPHLFVYYDKEKLACPRTTDLFDVDEKLLLRRTGDKPIASYDDKRTYNLHTLYSCRNKSEYSILFLLGLLNSRLFTFIYQQKMGTEIDRTFAEIKIVYIRQLPVVKIDMKNKTEKLFHDKIVKLVEQMLSSKKQFHNLFTDKDKNYYLRKYNDLDKEIDRLVYQLYGLTDDEIEIIEGKE